MVIRLYIVTSSEFDSFPKDFLDFLGVRAVIGSVAGCKLDLDGLVSLGVFGN
jgi:hypothetical protein